MNLLLGTFVGLLLVYLIAYTDFVLSRRLKERVKAINTTGWRQFSFRPLNWPLAAALALLFWGLPVLLPAEDLYLEYKLILALFLWSLAAGGFYGYLRHRTSARLAGQALPLLLLFAVACGVLLGPLFSILKKIMF
ncbi:MFS transporter [Desulfurivibrio sp. D14AmB]|uniref:MFS transporter n=1 Tax=Desulfurivibrio sp. D14AmB TaxID=3374370 RepID=UPI00376ECABE